MQVNFGGFVSLSTVDFPGISSCVVFFRGCSVRCPFCHNKWLWEGENFVDIECVKELILSSKKFISGVAFSGGEPAEQPDQLQELLAFCKKEGLKTCVHTSGLFPMDSTNIDMVHTDRDELKKKSFENRDTR